MKKYQGYSEEDYLELKEIAHQRNVESAYAKHQAAETAKMNNAAILVANEREMDIQLWMKQGLSREDAEFNSVMWI